MLTPSPVVEGKEDSRFLPAFLPEQPSETLEKGNFPNISLLTGVCKEETGRAVKGGFNRELQAKLQAVPDFLNKVLLKDLAGKASGERYAKLSAPNNNSRQKSKFWDTLTPAGSEPQASSTRCRAFSAGWRRRHSSSRRRRPWGP